MRKIALMFSFVLLLSSVCAFSQDEAPTPAFNDGDYWEFRIATKNVASSTKYLEDGVYELAYSQEKVKIFTIRGGQKTEFDENEEGLLGLLGMSRNRANLKFPLSVGQKWNYDYKYQPGGSTPQNRSVEVNVVAIEQINTPAGIFRAFRLSSEENWLRKGSRSSGFSKSIYFYSPQTKSIVNLNEEQEGLTKSIQLIKFGSVPK
jgi:hypothetical protein